MEAVSTLAAAVIYYCLPFLVINRQLYEKLPYPAALVIKTNILIEHTPYNSYCGNTGIAKDA